MAPPKFSIRMDQDLLNYMHAHYGRKITCSIAFAMQQKGGVAGHRIYGGLEYPFYEAYDLSLNRVLLDHKTLTICPQYRISFESRHSEDRFTHSRWPDFAILRSLSDSAGPDSWNFDTRTVLAVVEIKPLCATVPRNATLAQVGSLLEENAFRARLQAKSQVKHLFASRPSQQKAFAMVGVGPFWSFSMFLRDKTSPFIGRDEDEMDYVAKNTIVRSKRYHESPLAMLGTSASAAQFQRMLGLMKKEFEIIGDDRDPW